MKKPLNRINDNSEVDVERREGDSNPRYRFRYTAFPVLHNRPLCHLSNRRQSAFLAVLERSASAFLARWFCYDRQSHQQRSGNIVASASEFFNVARLYVSVALHKFSFRRSIESIEMDITHESNRT